MYVQEEGESHNMQLIPAAAGFTFSEDDMERLRDIDRLVSFSPTMRLSVHLQSAAEHRSSIAMAYYTLSK